MEQPMKLARQILGVLAILWLAGISIQASAAPSLTATWTKKAEARGMSTGPGGRGWVDLIYDPAIHKVVLFGGSGGDYYNDLWQYDSPADSWTRVEPFVNCSGITGFVPPTKRDEHVVEYDDYNRLYWTFGGSGFGCKGSARAAQSGTDSANIYDGTLVSDVPDYYKDWTVQANGKSAYVAGYDPAPRKLTLATPISGLASGLSYYLYTQRGGGTWHYSPATQTWTGFDGPHWGYSGPTPGNRLSPAFAYSSRDKALVMFGGDVSGDTWALDVTTQSWVRMLPAGAASPPARAQLQNSMVYDSLNDVFVLFGGRCKDSRCTYDNALNDTWVYRLSTNSWIKMNPPFSPPPRYQHHMAYDSVNHVVVLFGGIGRIGSSWYTYNDLWIYDYASNTWTQLSPAVSPTARWLGAFVQDQQNNLFVLYGGNTATGTSKEVWHLMLQGALQNQPPVAVANVAPAHQYANPGAYTVVLTVTDNLGATATASLNVNVSALTTPPRITLSSGKLSGTVDDPSITQLTANGTPVPVVNGTFEVNIPLGEGTTQINLQATGSGGSTTKSVTINVQ
jgi:hypothetical protein